MKTRFVLLLILIGLAGVVVTYYIDNTNRGRSGEAAVRILEEPERDGGYRVRYKYSVNGAEYTSVSSESESYQPGDAVKVCYDPDDPRDAGLVYANQRCGNTILFP